MVAPRQALPQAVRQVLRGSGALRSEAPMLLAGCTVSGQVLLAAVGLVDGRSFVDRAVDPDSMVREHWLAALPAGVVNAVTMGIGVLTLLGLAAMRRGVAGRWRPVLIAWGWTVAAFLVLVLPGNLSLYVVPFLLPLALFRAGGPELSVIALAATGIAVAFATLRYGRRTSPRRCAGCGRSRSSATSGAAWGAVATASAYGAALAPLGYATVRVLWALGVPVGTTDEFLEQINAANPGHDTVVMELCLAAMAVAGAVLCWGLTRPWSRTWPRWVPALRGRAVPRWLPVGTGIVCGAGLSGFATTLLPDVVRFTLGEEMTYPGTDVRMTWLSHLPAVSLICWVPLILAAAIGFGYRTRPGCHQCHRG